MLSLFGESFLLGREAVQAFSPLSDFWVYNLPGACWIALLTWLGLQVGSGGRFLSFPIYLLPFAVGQGMELTQALGISNGTYDPMDVLANTLGFVLATVCFAYRQPTPNKRFMYAKRWQILTFLIVFLSAFSVDA